MEIDNEYYERFPTVLRNALISGQVEFSQDVLFEYENMSVYRGIKYGKNKIKIDKTDFYSHVERNIPGVDRNDISSYGCSCFEDLEELHMITKFPRRNKAIAKGTIKERFGPCKKSNKNTHVDLFLYDNIDISGEFEVFEKWEENGLI